MQDVSKFVEFLTNKSHQMREITIKLFSNCIFLDSQGDSLDLGKYKKSLKNH